MQASEALTKLQSEAVEERRAGARFVFRQYETMVSATADTADPHSVSASDLYPVLRRACTDADPLVRGHVLSPFTAITQRLDRHLDTGAARDEQHPLRPVFDALQDTDDRVRQTAFGVLAGATAELLQTPVTDAETMAVVAQGVIQGLGSSNDTIRIRATRIVDGEIASAHPDPRAVATVLVDYLVGDRTADLPYMSDPAQALPTVAGNHPDAFRSELDRLTATLEAADRRDLTARTLVAIATNSEQDLGLDIDILAAGLEADAWMDRIEMAETMSEFAQSEPALAGPLREHLAVALLDPQTKARKRIGAALASSIAAGPPVADEELRVLLDYHDDESVGLTDDPVAILATQQPEFLLELFQRAFDRGRIDAFHRWVVEPAIDTDESLATGLLEFYERYLEQGDPEAVSVGLRGVSTLARRIPEQVADVTPAIVAGIERSDVDIRHGLEALLRILEATTPRIDDYDPLVDCLGSPDKRMRNMAAEILVSTSDAEAAVPAAAALSAFVDECESTPSTGPDEQSGFVAALLSALGGDRSTDTDDTQQQPPLEVAKEDDRWPLGIIASRVPNLAEQFVDTYCGEMADATPLRLREIGTALAEIAHARPEMVAETVDALVSVATDGTATNRLEAATDALDAVDAVAPEVVEAARKRSQ